MKKIPVSLAIILLLHCPCVRAQITLPDSITLDAFEGFWLGQCIANWTGLVTEMDKIGNLGEIKTGAFYTRDDWDQPDQPSIWAEGVPSDISPTIDFVLRGPDSIWGADDDTDIEYMYQHLLDRHQTTQLTPEQIRDGWLAHIRSEEENYLWVANQKAFDLMQEGLLPPATGQAANNEHYDMIDAQLTTEIFGLYAPGDPEHALKMAHLPIRTVADSAAIEIAEFYVVLYSLGAASDRPLSELADSARAYLDDTDYPAKMYDFVRARHAAGDTWEEARDAIYQRYQVDQADGYDITSRDLYCNGCFAAGINFAASLVSLFYGEGDLKETIKIGALCGWDSDNPTATWGGLIGYRMGRKKIETAFGQPLSDRFWIHRTRRGFPGEGYDTFARMARVGLSIQQRRK